MGANEEVKKVNYAVAVSEARVKQLIKEEEEIEQSDTEVSKLKAETIYLLQLMEGARRVNDEPKRRELRNEVVVKNLRLVTQVLKKYGYFSADKFQNGCIGLLKAAETFDLTREVPFPNYACFCIETEVRLAFKRVNRAFESKNRGFLDYIDAPTPGGEDKDMDRHEMIEDPFSLQEFDAIAEDAEVDTLFYDIIIPCIEEYGTRSKELDMELWRKLEIQYFIELSMEHSQRQRITFTEMAKQLGTVPQNIRTRHKKVVDMIKERLPQFGYYMERTYGRARVVKEVKDDGEHVKFVKLTSKQAKHTRKK